MREGLNRVSSSLVVFEMRRGGGPRGEEVNESRARLDRVESTISGSGSWGFVVSDLTPG